VSSAVTATLAGHGTGAWAAIPRRAYSVGPDLTLEPCAGSSKRVAWYVFVHVDGLRVLAEIVKTGEPARAVTLKGSFSGMFPGRESACETRAKIKIIPPTVCVSPNARFA
jgi:hypothetical protein